MPRAWYCPQFQIEKGDSRPSCQPSVRSQNVRAASSTFGSSSRIENASAEPTRKPTRKRATRRVFHSGYVAQSGATTSAANFVQPASAAKPPRSAGCPAKKKPNTSSAGKIVSFVFEFDAYCVKGYATHAND